MTNEPLLLDIADLVRDPGTSKELVIDANVAGLVVGMGRVDDDGAVHADLLLESLAEGILVTGQLTGRHYLECARCLIAYSVPFLVHVQEVFAYPDIEVPDPDDGYMVEDEMVDLLPMVRDEVLLAVPTNPLHDPDCKGLCAMCGTDLNGEDCGHRPDPDQSRWAPLEKLRDQLRLDSPGKEG